MKYDVNAIKYLFQISITECAEVVSLVTFTNKQVRVGLQIIVHSLDGFGCCWQWFRDFTNDYACAWLSLLNADSKFAPVSSSEKNWDISVYQALNKTK